MNPPRGSRGRPRGARGARGRGGATRSATAAAAAEAEQASETQPSASHPNLPPAAEAPMAEAAGPSSVTPAAPTVVRAPSTRATTTASTALASGSTGLNFKPKPVRRTQEERDRIAEIAQLDRRHRLQPMAALRFTQFLLCLDRHISEGSLAKISRDSKTNR